MLNLILSLRSPSMPLSAYNTATTTSVLFLFCSCAPLPTYPERVLLWTDLTTSWLLHMMRSRIPSQTHSRNPGPTRPTRGQALGRTLHHITKRQQRLEARRPMRCGTMRLQTSADSKTIATARQTLSTVPHSTPKRPAQMTCRNLHRRPMRRRPWRAVSVKVYRRSPYTDLPSCNPRCGNSPRQSRSPRGHLHHLPNPRQAPLPHPLACLAMSREVRSRPQLPLMSRQSRLRPCHTTRSTSLRIRLNVPSLAFR